MPSEVITVSGHIIDSLILPKVLDEIMDLNGTFEILEINIGKRKTDPSKARLRLYTKTQHQLEIILKKLSRLGAISENLKDIRLMHAPKNGVFPQGFYSTTNLPTQVRYRGRWKKVVGIEMDCGISVSPTTGISRCLPMVKIKKGDWIVCGSEGVKVTPLERVRKAQAFQFMGSAISSEKPKGQLIRRLAKQMRALKEDDLKILLVLGPAVIHTGGGPYVERMIRSGLVDILFAGNGFATHDIESSLMGTSLGIRLDRGLAVKDGHDHHMRAINTIRGLGGIKQAVRRGILTKGVMHACVEHKIPYVLAGSIRDDGPLPDVITDTIEAQQAMRKHIKGVGLALMVATTLHAIATGNMLPASVKTICVDINPAVVTKLSDRGTFQGIGIVSDTESFFRELIRALHL